MEIATSEGWAAPTVRRARPWWKTFLVSVLLCLIPVVGWGMGVHYIMTHDQPADYAPGRAAAATAILTGFVFLATLLIAVIIGGLGSA